MRRNYINKPTKEALKLRKAIVFYEQVAKECKLYGYDFKETRKTILSIKYRNKPEMTEAKNRVLQTIK